MAAAAAGVSQSPENRCRSANAAIVTTMVGPARRHAHVDVCGVFCVGINALWRA